MSASVSSILDILTAAETLFAAHGYDAVSMQKVAKAANTSKSNLYHHFKSKDDLYISVLKQACQAVHDLTHDLNLMDTNIHDRLNLFSREHLKNLHHNSQISKLILRELLDGDSGRGRELAQQVFQGQFLQMQQLLQSGQASGEIHQDMDAALMAVSLVGLNVFLFQSFPVLQHLSPSSFQHQEATGQAMFDLLWQGFASPNKQGEEQ